MKKRICILGATGSIGKQALEVCRTQGYEVVAMVAGSQFREMASLYCDHPGAEVAFFDENSVKAFCEVVPGAGAEGGIHGVNRLIARCRADIVINAIVGSAGILPTWEALDHTGRIALANKETLVTAGRLIMEKAARTGCEIIPVDSEHSAIHQVLQGAKRKDVEKLILTASGGPFLGYGIDRLESVSPMEALRHPTWEMGKKITVDSATLMNKGLEVIEAHWLFGVDYKDIQVVVHPQSIIHSMVEFSDGSLLAQMGAADMRIPIQYALTFPERRTNLFQRLDFTRRLQMEFSPPDLESFPALGLAIQAGKEGGTMPCVMNAANEEAVRLFLNGQIRFPMIAEIIRRVMASHRRQEDDNIDKLLAFDRWARDIARNGGTDH